MNSLTNPPSTLSGPGPGHLLLKADPCLKGDVADGKSGSSACNQLGQVSVLQYF